MFQDKQTSFFFSFFSFWPARCFVFSVCVCGGGTAVLVLVKFSGIFSGFLVLGLLFCYVVGGGGGGGAG